MTTPKAISNFDELTNPTDDDLLFTTSSGSSYKITKANFLNSYNNSVETGYDSRPIGVAFGHNNSTIAYSVAIGLDNTAYGGEFFSVASAFGVNNNATGSGGFAAGFSNTASGYLMSTAVGFDNLASGFISTAIGGENNATNDFATAIGGENNATAYCATAIGNQNIAYNSCTAVGTNNNIDGYSAIAIGNRNSSSGDYTILAGYDNHTYSNDYTESDRSILIGTNNNIFGGGESDRCILIGNYNVAYDENSVVVGDSNRAEEQYSIAIGRSNNSTDYKTISFGNYNTASQYYSVAIGNENSASGGYSIAAGYDNSASGYCGVSIGTENSANGNYSTAIGNDCSSGGEHSMAIGYECDANYDHANAIGYNCNANAENSTAIGYNAETTVSGTVVIGGPIAIQSPIGYGDDANDFTRFGGVETTLMSDEIDFSLTANLLTNNYGQGHAYKIVPPGASFYMNEVGIIMTDVNNLAYEPEIEFGTEDALAYNVTRVAQATAEGTGTSITFSVTPFSDNTTIIAAVVIDTSADIDIDAIITAGPAQAYMTPIQNIGYSNLRVKLFRIANAPGYTDIVFNFASSVGAKGFVFEYSGLNYFDLIDNYNSHYDVGTAPTSGNISSSIDFTVPANLWLSVIANEQADELTSPTNSASIIHESAFGSYRVAVLELITNDTTDKTLAVTSANSAAFVTNTVVFNAILQGTNDVIEVMPTDIENKRRYRYTTLGDESGLPYHGHSFLWAGVTYPASYTEGGRVKGRIYWKGLLVSE